MWHALKIQALCAFLLVMLPASTLAGSGPGEYKGAKSALEGNRLGEFRSRLAGLGDSPLKPVLEGQYLQVNFDRTDAATIELYLDTYPDVYVSKSLREKYLQRLRKQGLAGKFMEFYNDDITDVDLECHYLDLKTRNGGIDDATDSWIEQLWLTADSRPDSCDPVFSDWHDAGKLTDARVWQRIELAIARSRYRMAEYLSRTYLPVKQQTIVELWIAVRKHPDKKLAATRFAATEQAGKIITDGLEQVSRSNPARAEQIWMDLVRSNPKLARFESRVYARIGFRAAINHHPGASRYFRKALLEDEAVRHWAVRAALQDNQWPYVLEIFPLLTDEEQDSPQWRYWQARALENTGENELARQIYGEIAGQRDYYSFLAADRLGLKYNMNNHPIDLSTTDLENVRAFVIARELYKAEGAESMRRQWQWAIRGLDENQLKTAARLAASWGFHDRAIITVGRARYYDDVNMRFPVVHRQPISSQARSRRLPESWIYGIMRQESAFMENIRSPAGALGLMQVMPETGRLIWKKQNKRNYHSSLLLDPDQNISAGTFYLREMLDRFDNHYALATAAYNAGPNRAEQWRSGRSLDADIWIETIPFRETRGYVKNVLAYMAIYDYQLGLEGHKITALLPRVNAG